MRVHHITASFLLLVILSLHVAAQASLDQEKTDADKLYNEGNSLFRAGNYSAAIEKYHAALERAKDFKYYYQLGLAQKNSRQNVKAIAAFEEALKLKNDFSLGHNALGGTLLAERVYDKAIEAFKLALTHDPNMQKAVQGVTEAYAGQAQQLLSDGKYELAGKLIDDAMGHAHADNPKLHLVAAMVYNKLDQPEKAIELADEAIKLKKRGSKGAEYFEMGLAYKKLKDNEKARAAFGEARKDPAYSRNAQYELESLKGR